MTGPLNASLHIVEERQRLGFLLRPLEFEEIHATLSMSKNKKPKIKTQSNHLFAGILHEQLNHSALDGRLT